MTIIYGMYFINKKPRQRTASATNIVTPQQNYALQAPTYGPVRVQETNDHILTCQVYAIANPHHVEFWHGLQAQYERQLVRLKGGIPCV